MLSIYRLLHTRVKHKSELAIYISKANLQEIFSKSPAGSIFSAVSFPFGPKENQNITVSQMGSHAFVAISFMVRNTIIFIT